MSVTEGSEGNKITNEVFERLCVCVERDDARCIPALPAEASDWPSSWRSLHSLLRGRKKEKKKHSRTPENLPIFEKSRTYSRLLSHSRGQRTCKLRRAREAVTSD